MPRTVDHDERRSMILDAFVSVAAREGLHAVSLRSVAGEAGVSLRLVQYYFETKAGLMRAGLSLLEKVSNERWSDRLASLPQPPTARATLRALFAEALPTGPQSRTFHLLWMSYAVMAMTDAEIPGRAVADCPNRLQRRISELLTQGKVRGEFRGDLDVDAESSLLLGLIHGLGTAVLIGQQTGEAALAHLTFQLDRLGDAKGPI